MASDKILFVIMRLDIYTITCIFTGYVLSRNIESSYVPKIEYSEKREYMTNTSFSCTPFFHGMSVRVPIIKNEPISWKIAAKRLEERNHEKSKFCKTC